MLDISSVLPLKGRAGKHMVTSTSLALWLKRSSKAGTLWDQANLGSATWGTCVSLGKAEY